MDQVAAARALGMIGPPAIQPSRNFSRTRNLVATLLRESRNWIAKRTQPCRPSQRCSGMVMPEFAAMPHWHWGGLDARRRAPSLPPLNVSGTMIGTFGLPPPGPLDNAPVADAAVTVTVGAHPLPLRANATDALRSRLGLSFFPGLVRCLRTSRRSRITQHGPSRLSACQQRRYTYDSAIRLGHLHVPGPWFAFGCASIFSTSMVISPPPAARPLNVTDGALQATPASIALDELTAGNVVKVAHGWCPISALLGTIFQKYRHWSTGRSLESIERRRQQCVFLQKKAALQLHAADLASDYVYEADANGSATERKAWQSSA